MIQNYARHVSLGWREMVHLTYAQFEYYGLYEEINLSLRPLVLEMIQAPAEKRSLALLLHSFYCFHGRHIGASFQRWGDKTPLNSFFLPEIHSVFPDAQYLHMVRDGVDAAHSYVEAGLQPNIEAAAERWRQSIRAVEAFMRDHAQQCLEVRYEALATDPASTVERVCQFLGLPFDPAMVNSTEPIDSMGDVAKLAHLANVQRPINAASIGKGRTRLDPTQRQIIQRTIGDDLVRLGYQPAI